jgi:hypothetical protein
MARTLSSTLKTAVNAQETGEVVLAITQISHPSILNGPLRVVNDLQNLTSNGKVYSAFPFQVTLPEEREDSLPRLRLVLDNIDRTIVAAIRSIPPSEVPTVQVDLVLASTPDTLELSFPGLSLREVSYDVYSVEGEVLLDEDDREPFPADSLTPQIVPAIF